MKIEIDIPEAVLSAIAEEVVGRIRPLLAARDAGVITHAPPGRGLLNEKEVALRTGLSLQTLRNYRSGGTGPPYYKVNGRSVRYKESEVAAWVESFKVSPRWLKFRNF